MSRPLNHKLYNNILSASFALFYEKGVKNTATREIAARAGTERGLLHHYFKKKQDILFALYNDFLESILSFIMMHYADKDGFQMMAILNAIYYRIIFSRENLVRIFADILENRDLTKIKIEKTTDVYVKILHAQGVQLPRQDILLSSMVAIGAEVELVLGILEGTLSWSQDVLTEQITRLFMMNLPVPYSEVDQLIQKAHDIAQNADLQSFSLLMEQECSWFRPVN